MRLSKNSSGLRIILTRQEYEHLGLTEDKVFLRFHPESVSGFMEIAPNEFSDATPVILRGHSAKASENYPGLMMVKWLRDPGYASLPDFGAIDVSSKLEADNHVTTDMPPAQRMSRMKARSRPNGHSKALAPVSVPEHPEVQDEPPPAQAIAGEATFRNLQGAVDLVNRLRDEIPGTKISVGKGGRLVVNVQFGG